MITGTSGLGTADPPLVGLRLLSSGISFPCVLSSGRAAPCVPIPWRNKCPLSHRQANAQNSHAHAHTHSALYVTKGHICLYPSILSCLCAPRLSTVFLGWAWLQVPRHSRHWLPRRLQQRPLCPPRPSRRAAARHAARPAARPAARTQHNRNRVWIYRCAYVSSSSSELSCFEKNSMLNITGWFKNMANSVGVVYTTTSKHVGWICWSCVSKHTLSITQKKFQLT